MPLGRPTGLIVTAALITALIGAATGTAATGSAERVGCLSRAEATCSSGVEVGHSYRASVRLPAGTPEGTLEVWERSYGTWQPWYSPAVTSEGDEVLSTLLDPIQGAVERVAFTWLPKTGAAIDLSSSDVSLVDASTHTFAVHDTAEQSGRPLSARAAHKSSPRQSGAWTVLEGLAGARAIHAVLLQNGQVLIMAGSGNDRMEFEAGSFKSFLYDPVANTWRFIPTPKDLFCAGHVQLANGNVLVLGGTKAYPPAPKDGEYPSTVFEGENTSWIFNIHTDAYEQVPYDEVSPHNGSEPGPLLNGAWYPSATELGNGDVISFGGLDEQGQGSTKTNYYTGPENAGADGDPGEQWVGFGSSKLQQTYPWFWGEYPSMILTADGRLFYGGSHVFGNGIENSEEAPSGSSLYDFYCTPGEDPNHPNPNATVTAPNGTFKRVTDTPGLREPDLRDQSAELLLPPAQSQKVMIMGGGNTYTTLSGSGQNAIDLTDEIDLSAPTPHWEAGPALPAGEMEDGTMEPAGAGKMYVSAVALPDGTVLETGGSLHVRGDNVLEASIFNPSSNAFTSVAADPVGRDYHSEALLLPDGRVLTLGSNPVDAQTGVESFESRVSIYQPPYLFKGARPSLNLIDGEANSSEGETSVTKTRQWEYGTEHHITYRSSSKVTSAVLIRPAAVTHSSDPNQREVTLPIASTKTVRGTKEHELTVDLTSNPDLAPPGYYMVFLVTAKGVPSVAQWVHVGAQGRPAGTP